MTDHYDELCNAQEVLNKEPNRKYVYRLEIIYLKDGNDERRARRATHAELHAPFNREARCVQTYMFETERDRENFADGALHAIRLFGITEGYHMRYATLPLHNVPK